MNNDLTIEADPQEVIEQLKAAYQEVREENKRLRADVMFLENWKAELEAERDAYRKALEKIYTKGMFGYINGDAAGTLAIMSKEVLDKYPSPSKDTNDGTK